MILGSPAILPTFFYGIKVGEKSCVTFNSSARSASLRAGLRRMERPFLNSFYAALKGRSSTLPRNPELQSFFLAALGRLRRVFLNIVPDKFNQNICHLLALCGSRGFECIVQVGFHIQVHALPPWLSGHFRPPPSSEMSLYVYE